MTYCTCRRSDVQMSQKVFCILNKMEYRRCMATNFWLSWPSDWWTTAVSSSLMQETSTTPQRSSEVSAPVPWSPPTPDIIAGADDRLFMLAGSLLERPCSMCYAVFLWWQLQHLQRVDSNQDRPPPDNVNAVCVCLLACVYPCGCTVCAASCRESTLMLSPQEKLLFKQEALRRLCGWTFAIISASRKWNSWPSVLRLRGLCL